MRKIVLFAVLLFSSALVAQQAEVTYSDGFQASAFGWMDIAVGAKKPLASGLYRTWPDPIDSANVVYGTKQASGNDLRGGTFSILETPRFSGRFEFRGRLLRTNDDARVGVTFFSSYPERDAYYLIALNNSGGGKRRSARSQAAAGMTMQLTAHGGAAPGGTLDSEVSLEANRWYEFAIEADSFDNATHIRARFWPRGTPEPSSWQIEARDRSVWRLDAGRIGIWSAVRGESYADDLSAKSWAAAEERVEIRFFDGDTQQELDPSKLALFKRPARIEVRGATTVKLDGADYDRAPIATDGVHVIVAESGFVTATLRLLVDQVPPIINLLGNAAPLIDGHVFGNDVTVDAKVTDVSTVMVTSSMGALPLPLAQEAAHSVTVTAIDQVGWESTATAAFTIDKTAPVVTINGNGVPFVNGYTFNQDVVLTWSATDATLGTVTATLNGASVESGLTVTAGQAHALVVTATDRAGHSTRATRDFVLRKGAPEIRLLANGSPLVEKTYGAIVAITAEVVDPTPVTLTATLDNQPYILGNPISVEGAHAFTITAKNAAGLETILGPIAFAVDVTPPVVTLTESGAPFSEGMKFNRDVVPALTVRDNLTTALKQTLVVNGREHILGAPVSEERLEHVITASATDDAGHTTTIGPFRFLLDKTRPVVTIADENTGLAFPPDALFATPVKVKVTVEDLTATTVSATLGGLPVDVNAPITANGTHQLSVTATDVVGWQSNTATATFTIDTIAPAIRFTTPERDATVRESSVDVIGFADDATSITVNGRAAQIDTVNKTFAVQDLALAEGGNELVAVATDRAGNSGTATHAVTLDSRAPQLTITAPAADACLDAASVEVRGTVTDRAVARVTVNGTAAAIANGAFTATVPLAGEGEVAIVVEAADTAGHTATATVRIVVDRTAPQIGIFEASQPFAATLLTRPVALFIRATDAGATTVVTTLNGQPYASGSAIAEDRVHELKVVATDCAGHTSTRTISFEIDRQAPKILTIAPQNGATEGAKPAITGTTSGDAVTLVVEPGAKSYPVVNGAFSIPDAPLVDGTNELRFTVTDRAGNSAEETYRLTLDLTTPSVEIAENGVPIAANALFIREVRPVVRSSERNATISATLNGNPFVSGTAITASGTYTLTATATDSFGRVSAPATATFAIDRDRPAITITSPANGTQVDDERVDVRGTVTGGDVQTVTINGVTASVVNGAFATFVPVELGPNLLVATAIDRAGNTASHQVEVTRGSGPVGIILTAPYDGLLTNRRTTVVAGQILAVTAGAKVTINGVEVAVDPSGFFRKTDFALAEGENVITAVVTAGGGESNQTSVRVTSDLTPPRLRLLESGQPLAEGARFADKAVISAEASDGTVNVVVDSDPAAATTTVDEDGGHTIVATARDNAGNETRVERTFFIGAAGTAACRLENFDPVNGSVVTSARVTISGQSGGAIGVKVNGTPALVSNGSFCATIELPAEGENGVTIVCTDADGNATGDPASLVLRRTTADPSIAIESPAEGSVTVSDSIAVSGTASGASVVEVNGSPVAFAGDSWSVPSIRLSAGLNVIAVRARNAAGRTVVASRRVLYLKDAPALTITSPATAITTGSARIDVSGGWANVDSATIAIAGTTVDAKSLSDTTGTFVAPNVPLVSGQNTIVINARDAAGRTTSASIVVTLSAGYPSVSITEPADNDVFGFESPATFTVRGAFTAATGATVEVGGEAATVDAATSTFTATVTHAAGRVTPVLVRVTEPGGNTAFDSIRVTRLEARPKVLEQFPIADAVNVDAAAMPLVLFSAPMDLASIASAFRLENAAGAPVSGTLRLDRDVVTFAPAALLTAGERYTVRIAQTAKAISGDALENAFASSFTIASSAGSTAPTLAPIASACAQQVAITGTAPPNARLRIDLGALSFTTTATSTGAWSFPLPVGGYSGYQVVRVRIVGNDGSLSPATESCFLLDCAGPQVLSANYDRTANRLIITFTEDIKPSSATGDAIVLRLADNRVVGATIVVSADVVTVTPAEDLTQKTFTVNVSTAIEDTGGTRLSFAYAQTFTYESDAPPVAGDGSGFMSGEVFDAETGRPLGGATVFVDVAPAPLVTDARGRYAAQLPEGAHTIRVAATGYTTVWRQIIIPAGAGVIPIDIRLTPTATVSPARSPSSQATADYTLVDAQSLPGLLPLGWSPLAAAVVTTTGQIELAVPAAEITAAAQVLTAVRYHDDRDEWRVLIAAANITNGTVTLPIDEPGAYALVYQDKAPDLAHPPAPAAGAVLTGVADVCATQTCGELIAESFVLDPPLVLPTGKTLATLKIKGAPPANFPSGTAVQAYVDEELRLADGSRVTDPPFTTDLLLYRNLAGTLGVAEFKLGPSPRAAEVILDIGFNHIRILPYPGRLDRGSLVGIEGGRVPGDGRVTIEIPAGAAPEAMRATSATIDALGSFGSIAGFTIVSGFTLTLELARQVTQPEGLAAGSPELLQSARATFPNAPAGQYILVEVLDGPRFRLAAQMESIAGSRVTTKAIDRALLPVDGVIREGRYLLLKANAPIAFATGILRDANGIYLRDSRVSAPPLGVIDATRVTGTYAVPVPAAAFTLVPYTPRTGEGTPYIHPTSPAAGEVVRVDLTLQTVAPKLIATEPNGGASEVPLTAFVKAQFDFDLDPSSINHSSIVVVDAATQAAVTADVLLESPRTVLWRLRGGEDRLAPNRRYAVTIASTIRSAAGSPFGRTHSFHFSTVTQVTSAEIHREKIRITIPDANGRSRVIGAAGALPSGYIALVTRRVRDFATPFQATAAADGSFTININERVALTDLIDLQVLNNARAIAAIIPLTPFSSDDGTAFIAPPDRAARFVSPDGIAITVPEGAFDVPTLVTVAKAEKAPFTTVPNFDQELIFAAGVTLQFEGIARKRLEVELPIPAGTDTARTYYLGQLASSVRGPRVMIVDLLRIANGTFTTTDEPERSPILNSQSSILNPAAVMTGREARTYLLGATRSGTYSALAFSGQIAWVFVQGVAAAADYFFDTHQSLFAASFYMAERGKILVPVAADKPFTIIGVDPSSGGTIFSKTYAALPPGDPGAATAIASPMDNVLGPYPVFTTPARVETIDLDQKELVDESLRNFIVTFDGNVATLKNGAVKVPADTRVELLNLGTGNRSFSADFPNDLDGLAVNASKGDRLLIFVEEQHVDPASTITVVFNKPIFVASEASLRDLFTLSILDANGVPQAITAESIEPQSGNRRFLIHLRGSLQRGGQYRLTLSRQIRDDIPGADVLRLGQRRGEPPLDDDIHLYFGTRAPQGLVGSFELSEGSVRDLAMSGNVLLVSALDAGLLAYDASNPAGLTTAQPFAKAAPPQDATTPGGTVIPGQSWAVAADPHGRIYTTAMSSTFGLLRSYRVEGFIAAAGTPDNVAHQSNAIVSWRPGINVGLPLASSNLIISDRPEAIPRKLRIVTQDDSSEIYSDMAALLGAYPAGAGTPLGNGFQKVELTIPYPTSFAYLRQRVTVVNLATQFRWSVDVPRGGTGQVTVIGRATDHFQVIRNATTYGVVNLFGYGVGLFDLNAIESNTAARLQPDLDPSYKSVTERILITKGEARSCDPARVEACDAGTAAAVGTHCAPKDLTLSPESEIGNGTGSELIAWALDANRGVVELRVTPPQEDRGAMCDRSNYIILAERVITASGFQWFAHPRLNTLRRLYRARADRDPIARFTSIDSFTRDGVRYGLVAGFEYGVPVVRLDPNVPLSDASLVDVIWIPAGAHSVRVLEGNQLATVVDGKGRVLLIDLTKIDESGLVEAAGLCGSITCEAQLYPTAAGALDPNVGNAGLAEIGADDPRVVWKSEEGLVTGTLPPLVDADTGFVYTGSVNDKKMRVLSAADPRIRLMSDPRTLEALELKSIVPLGIRKPASRANESLASFRVEVALPGSMAEVVGSTLPFTVESERVFGAVVPQLDPALLPPNIALPLAHLVPPSADPMVQRLRYQRGWNRFVSAPVVAIADPRASNDWTGPRVDCDNCERPAPLENDDSVKELYSAGRLLSIRPAGNVFAGTPYAYLSEQGRLIARVETIPADIIRPEPVEIAAKNPPLVSGVMRESYYAHSGELETAQIDLAVAGRGDTNVVIDRTYRSRTIGSSPFGAGWDSTIFRRLRPLPDDDVEYRDGMGSVWLFKFEPEKGTYEAPKGLPLLLMRADRGWHLVDAHTGVTLFDAAGRLVRHLDRFVTGNGIAGNSIQYLYDARGLLIRIVDPLGRATALSYDAKERVREVRDWRERTVLYEYDDTSRLKTVRLPESGSELGAAYSFLGINGRPRIEYVYDPTDYTTINDKVELARNLVGITRPAEAIVEFGYDPVRRDRIATETTKLPECPQPPPPDCGIVRFTYPVARTMKVVDLARQSRTFETTDPADHDRRAHLSKITEHAVGVVTAGDLSTLAVAPTAEQPAQLDLVTELKYDALGDLKHVIAPDGTETIIRYAERKDNAAQQVADEINLHAPGGQVLRTKLNYHLPGRGWNVVASVTKDDSDDDERAITREIPTPFEGASETTVSDEELKFVRRYDTEGRPTEETVSGEALARSTKVDYDDKASEPLARGRVSSVASGEDEADGDEGDGNEDGGGTRQTFTYARAPNQGEVITTTDARRGTVTVQTLDAYGRPIALNVTGADRVVLTDERYGYDASGRLVIRKRKQGAKTITEKTRYDDIGRAVETSIDHAEVDGAEAEVRSKVVHNLPGRTVKVFDPFVTAEGAFTLTTSDGLGRPIERKRGSLTTIFGYDKQGNLAYETDGVSEAVLHQYDGFGRLVMSLRADGTRTDQTWSAWGEPLVTRELARRSGTSTESEVIAQTSLSYTGEGRQRGVHEAESMVANVPYGRATESRFVGNEVVEVIRTGLGPANQPLSTDDMLRTRRLIRDKAGRTKTEIIGLGTLEGIQPSNAFLRREVNTFSGAFPQKVTVSEPKVGSSYASSTSFDGLGRPVKISDSGRDEITSQEFDEAGNRTLILPAGHKEKSTATYDSRGLLLTQTEPEETVIAHQYDARGALRKRHDEDDPTRVTSYDVDALGRPTTTTYPDGTFEELKYEEITGRVAARRDRAGVWLSYFYDAGGRISEVRIGQRALAPTITPSGPLHQRFTYDLGGRLTAITSKDAALEYGEYDLLGRPRVTRSIRYAEGSGFAATPVVLDSYTQRHVWSVFDGERERWSFPYPTSGNLPAAPWYSFIAEEYDAGGNLVSQRPAASETAEPDAPLITASARGIGRLSSRVRSSLSEEFGYADGGGDPSHLAPGLPSGLLGRVRAEINGTTAGGSVIDRDDAYRVQSSTDFGIRRTEKFDYDERGRLTESGNVTETLIHADFRSGRTVEVDPDDREELGTFASSVLPPSWTALKNSVHHIASRTVEGEDAPRAYDFANGRRASDGVWQHAYDEGGRLISLTRGDQRIRYVYNPSNRIVGRIAEQQVAGTWRLETRTNILARDALPAQTTWVWDPVTDRLIAMFETGGRLLRQILHGGAGYDDPLVFLIANDDGQPRKFLPIIDRPSGGSVTAIATADGKLAERILYADAYGDGPRYLHGPVVDRISYAITKDSSGAITEVKVSVRLSEEIDLTTLATGARLAAIEASPSNTVVALAPVAPTLDSSSRSIEWTLTAAQWSDFTTPPATRLEIAITDTLRAKLWSGPVMPLAPWQLDRPDRASTPATPVVHRESLANINAVAAGVGAGESEERTRLEISDLYLVAAGEAKTRVGAGFKAAPFIEPASGLVYLRDRWYDPAGGTFLTADPEWYTDGSNLYAAFKADPANNSDPTGRVVPQAIGCGASVLLGFGITKLTRGTYSWKDAGIDCGLGAATVGLSALGQLRHLRNASQLTRWGARVGAEMALDVGSEWARREWEGGEYTWNELATGVTLNAIIGEGGAYVGRSIGNRIRSAFDFDFRFDLDELDVRGIEAQLNLSGVGSRKRLGVLITTADAVNASFPPDYRPPYLPGARVTEYTTAFNEMFVRVHGLDNKARSWMMRAEAIRGLTAREIQMKYNLPDLPEFVSDVLVPAGTRMRTGRVNAVFGGNRGAVQYQLLHRLDETAYRNTRKLRQ